MLLNFSLYNRSHREHTANKATATRAQMTTPNIVGPTMLGAELSPPLLSRFVENAPLSLREEKEVSLLG